MAEYFVLSVSPLLLQSCRTIVSDKAMVLRESAKGRIPLNQMQAARCVNDAADLAGIEAERGVLKLLLHVALAKIA